MLTERRIRDARPEARTRILWDSQVKGLGLRVTPAGTKSYILNYRVGGRERRATLARTSELSLKAVRARATEELAAIRTGKADPLERRREARRAPTVADGLERFFGEYAPARMEIGRITARTVKDYRQQALQYLVPALGSQKIRDVTRRDVEAMVGPLTKVRRNRVLALVSRLFTLFETWEWRPQNTNPARGVERAREDPRDRTFSPTELSAFELALKHSEERHPAPVAAIRLAAVTGLRISEILGFRWEHLDLESGRLTLPTTKTGRRVHYLPAVALAILNALPRINDWALTTGRDAPVTYWMVRKVFTEAAGAAGLVDVRLHDLRRTVMTRAAMAGVGTHVLRDLLGHKTTAMADRYVRAVGNPVRDAREHVGEAMAAMMQGKTGDVAPIPHEG
ncbi:MAG: site-specific integrase [Gammaproteobacteria bacterium]|nr:site-specific integrase [Gammaproteobacteria bacterium]